MGSGLGSSSSYIDLDPHTFLAFGETHKFTTKGNLWGLQYGLGEVNISIEDAPENNSYLVFSFVGKGKVHIFRYNPWTRITDDSQANGMFFSSTINEQDVSFLFFQPKELTPLGTTKLSWAIEASWDSIPQGYPVEVEVAIEPNITSISLSI